MPSFKKISDDGHRAGQALLITVVVIGTVLLSATAIAGLLMIYQIRGSTDIANSQRALAAADAGLECQMYDEFQEGQPNYSYLNCSQLSFNDTRTAVEVSCDNTSDPPGNPTVTAANCASTSTVSTIYAKGSYNGASRILLISF